MVGDAHFCCGTLLTPDISKSSSRFSRNSVVLDVVRLKRYRAGILLSSSLPSWSQWFGRYASTRAASISSTNLCSLRSSVECSIAIDNHALIGNIKFCLAEDAGWSWWSIHARALRSFLLLSAWWLSRNAPSRAPLSFFVVSVKVHTWTIYSIDSLLKCNAFFYKRSVNPKIIIANRGYCQTISSYQNMWAEATHCDVTYFRIWKKCLVRHGNEQNKCEHWPYWKIYSTFPNRVRVPYSLTKCRSRSELWLECDVNSRVFSAGIVPSVQCMVTGVDWIKSNSGCRRDHTLYSRAEIAVMSQSILCVPQWHP